MISVIDRMLGQLGGAPLCPRCEKRVYFNEEKNFAGKKWHKSCFICSMILNFVLPDGLMVLNCDCVFALCITLFQLRVP